MKKLLLTLAILFFPHSAFALIASSSVAVDDGGGGATMTLLNVSATSSKNIVIAFVEVNGDVSGTCTSASVNGVAMTKLNAGFNVTGAGWMTVWYVIGMGGTQNLTMVGCTVNQVNKSMVAYSGVSQTSPIDNSINNLVSSGTSIATSLTTNSNNAVMVSFMVDGVGTGVTADVGTFKKLVNYGGFIGIGDSGGAITPATLYSMKWLGTLASLGVIQLSIVPDVPLSAPSILFGNYYGNWY